MSVTNNIEEATCLFSPCRVCYFTFVHSLSALQCQCVHGRLLFVCYLAYSTVAVFFFSDYPTLLRCTLLYFIRYDDNIEFVKVYLNPHIERFRAKTARYYESEWKNNFNLTLSFADGSSARTSAINAAIRLYK